MQEIGKFIDFLGQDSIREAIPVITAIGGALVVVLRFIFKVIYAQNMNEIDKVFMNRKQRTNLKLTHKQHFLHIAMQFPFLIRLFTLTPNKMCDFIN